VHGSAPWARDNIFFAGVMAIAPALAMYLRDRNQTFDWGTVRMTLWLYLLAFVAYCLYLLIRAAFGVRAEDREMAVSESRLLFTFEAQAVELVGQLEAVCFHWNNAGEKLLRPLDTNDANSPNSHELQMELRDFKNTYGKHLQRIGMDVPRFHSKASVSGYPSEREYPEVLADLKDHAQLLGDIAEEVYRTRKVI
jgi:hypothetical protein